MCVGDEDGSEAVGDAQQVGFFIPLSHCEEEKNGCLALLTRAHPRGRNEKKM